MIALFNFIKFPFEKSVFKTNTTISWKSESLSQKLSCSENFYWNLLN